MRLQEQLGKNLKKAREKNGMTQFEVAKKVDITVNYYAMIERGEVNPSFSIVQKLQKLLKISPSSLF